METVGRADMWILDSYCTDRAWLAPACESMFIWPHHSTSTGDRLFAHKTLSHILKVAHRVTQTTQVPSTGVLHILLPLRDDHNYCLPIKITRDARSLYELFGVSSVIHDVDSGLLEALEVIRWDTIICVNVCTYRFDDAQHVIVAMLNDRIVWQTWTVIEDRLRTSRVAAHDNAMRLSLCRHVFLFDRSAPMLSHGMRMSMRRLLARLFAMLPEEIAWHIADLLHRDTNSVTLKQFHNGACRGVFNYAVARLLRVAWHRGLTDLSLLTISRMEPGERNALYKILRTTLRERHRVFDRKVCHKRTRSGGAY